MNIGVLKNKGHRVAPEKMNFLIILPFISNLMRVIIRGDDSVICKHKGCNNNARALGFCTKHYQRFKKYGSSEYTSVKRLKKGKNPKDKIRLNVTVDKNDCWIWQGTINEDGYGIIYIGYDKYRAHRHAYELFFGEIPEGKQVCHRCDNPICCNPEHLFLCTQADNVRDMIAKNRQVYPTKRKGEQLSYSKLTNVQAAQVKKMLVNGKKQKEIADHFGVSRYIITFINTDRSWNHIPWPRKRIKRRS